MIVAGIPKPIAIRSDPVSPEDASEGESAGDDELDCEVDEEGHEDKEGHEDEEDKRGGSCDWEGVEVLIIEVVPNPKKLLRRVLR